MIKGTNPPPRKTSLAHLRNGAWKDRDPPGEADCRCVPVGEVLREGPAMKSPGVHGCSDEWKPQEGRLTDRRRKGELDTGSEDPGALHKGMNGSTRFFRSSTPSHSVLLLHVILRSLVIWFFQSISQE